MKARPVVCVGLAAMDMVFDVQTMPFSPTKHPARGRREIVGGIAANAALAIAKLGGAARLVGRVGTDGQGEALRKAIGAAGVDVEHLEACEGATSFSAVFVDAEGERMLVNHKDTAIFSRPPSPQSLYCMSAAMCDRRWPEAAAAALDVARATGVPGILDFDAAPEDGRELIGRASHVVFGADALRTQTGESDLMTALDMISSAYPHVAFAVTAGELGAYWRQGCAAGRVPAFPVKAVDTLGAGDVFHGAVALALSEYATFEEALRFAAAVAAAKVSRPSGPNSFPSREDANRIMETA